MMTSDLVRANSFELSGDSIQISYSDTSFLGGPQLNYSDNSTNRTFRGEEISSQDTALGQLITVTLEEIADLRTVTFTLILAIVNLTSQSQSTDIKVPGIVTTTQTTIAGPGPGVEKTYSLINLQGIAQFIVS